MAVKTECVCLNQSYDGKRDIIMRDAWPTERRNCTNQDRRSQNQIFRWRIRIDAVSKEKKDSLDVYLLLIDRPIKMFISF